jgi:hypothetical protein
MIKFLEGWSASRPCLRRLRESMERSIEAKAGISPLLMLDFAHYDGRETTVSMTCEWRRLLTTEGASI